MVSAPEVARPPVNPGKDVADKILIESEKYKAQLAAPKGNDLIVDQNVEILRKFDNDDDFFHITCHVDPNVKQKIQQGDFVDLEKLIPKDRGIGGNPFQEEGAMELVTQDGHTYFTPARDRDTKISSLKRWDQAFRIYAAVYTEANPSRSAEVWQYVYVIHRAAQSYQWDNVLQYDTTFRRLMAEKPWHSWSKTYTQGWNLAMNDPLPRHNKGGPNKFFPGHGGNSDAGGKSWKDSCCWKFNKGKCSASAAECDFDHMCTYCEKWGHGFHVCYKRLAKTGKAGGNNPTTTINSSTGNSGPSAK